MADLFKNSDEELRRLRAISYDEYLQSPWWRKRRHARLKKANWKCERCAASVASVANVHHLNYDRLGAERDTDLEVLCRRCHAGHHTDESRKHNLGVYLKLASETVRLDQPTNVTDFKEALIARCKAFDLPIDHRVDDAIRATQGRLSLVTEARRREVAATPDLGPISQAEAIELLRAIKAYPPPIRSMPEPFGTGLGVAAIRDRAAARLKAACCPHCRHRGALPSRTRPGFVYCLKCTFRWQLPIDGAEHDR